MTTPWAAASSGSRGPAAGRRAGRTAGPRRSVRPPPRWPVRAARPRRNPRDGRAARRRRHARGRCPAGRRSTPSGCATTRCRGRPRRGRRARSTGLKRGLRERWSRRSLLVRGGRARGRGTACGQPASRPQAQPARPGHHRHPSRGRSRKAGCRQVVGLPARGARAPSYRCGTVPESHRCSPAATAGRAYIWCRAAVVPLDVVSGACRGNKIAPRLALAPRRAKAQTAACGRPWARYSSTVNAHRDMPGIGSQSRSGARTKPSLR